MTENKTVIFIIGYSRSGTTLMANVLGKNSLVSFFRELHFFEKFWIKKEFFDREKAFRVLHRLFCSQRIHPYRSCHENMFIDEIEDFLENYDFPVDGLKIFSDFLFYETKRNGKKIPCEQTPRNLFYLDSILKSFPEAKIIFMIRDPRDILLSQKFKWKRYFKSQKNIYPIGEAIRSFINYHPITISLLWKASVSFVIPYLANPNVKCVKFEELIFFPKETILNISKFIGIAFEETMLDVPYAFSSIFDDEKNKVGFDTRRTGNWKEKLNSAEVFIVELFTGKLMKNFGYEKSNKVPNLMFLVYYLFIFLPKIILTILLNFSRNKNVFYSIYKRVRVLFG